MPMASFCRIAFSPSHREGQGRVPQPLPTPRPAPKEGKENIAFIDNINTLGAKGLYEDSFRESYQWYYTILHATSYTKTITLNGQ